MDTHTLGFILHVMGELIIAYSVLVVHFRVSSEMKIDIRVARAMGRERIAVFLGAAFIVAGAVLEKFV